MKAFEFKIGTGLAWVSTEVIIVEDFENEQDALDQLIDKMEQRGDNRIIDLEYVEKEGINGDEYIVGGNHSKSLVHSGTFIFREITDCHFEYEVYDCDELVLTTDNEDLAYETVVNIEENGGYDIIANTKESGGYAYVKCVVVED